MILHPGILALIAGSLIATAMMLYASALGVTILRTWDIASSSPTQLALERKTYLISTIMNSVFGFEIFSALLFVYTVDDMHRIFVGAMCATGTLNANPVGWDVLYAKIVIFFVSSIWIGFNYVDQRADDYPLVRKKYAMLLLIAPLVALDAWLQVRYFTGLKPDVITSCCGSLFSESGSGIAAGMSSLPLKPAMALFYGTLALFLVNALAALRFRSPLVRYAMPLTSLLAFVAALTGVVSFVSSYYYELPTHHCPFCILQAEYGYVGYALYLTLLGGALSGMGTGVLMPFRNTESLRKVVPSVQRRLALASVVLFLIFTAIVTARMVFSDFIL